MKYLKLHAGFTLVELIIVMGMTSIFVVVLTDIFVSLTATKIESESTAAVVEDGRFILSRLAYDAERADTVTTPLILGASSTSLVLNIDGTNYTYSLSGGDLMLNNSSNTTSLNSDRTVISDISFQKLGNFGGSPTVKLSFTVTSLAELNSGPRSQTFSTTIGLR